MDSNLIHIEPPTRLECPLCPPKVVAKNEDILGHTLGVLHMVVECSHLVQGPKGD
jgi:hypothetical protein